MVKIIDFFWNQINHVADTWHTGITRHESMYFLWNEWEVTCFPACLRTLVCKWVANILHPENSSVAGSFVQPLFCYLGKAELFWSNCYHGCTWIMDAHGQILLKGLDSWPGACWWRISWFVCLFMFARKRVNFHRQVLLSVMDESQQTRRRISWKPKGPRMSSQKCND